MKRFIAYINEKKEQDVYILILLLLVGLSFRIICFLQSASNPLSSQLVLDETYYVSFGRAVASGYLLGEPSAFYMDPFYGYFLGFIFFVFGEDLALLKFLQLLLDVVNVFLIYYVGKSIAGRDVGSLSALFYAVYPIAVFYSLLVLKTTLTVTFLLVFTLFLIKVAEGKRSFSWFLLGSFVGLMVYLRANLLLVMPFALFAYWFVESPRLKDFVLHGILFLAGVILLLFPGAIRNSIVTGEMLWLNSQSGRLLYLCNNPENLSGLYNVPSFARPDPVGMEEDFQREAEKVLGRVLTVKEVSTFWRNQTLSFLWENPQDVLRLMANKIKYIVGNEEIPVNYSYSLAARFSSLFQFHFPNFAFAFAFGILGFFFLLRENRKCLWLTPPIFCLVSTMLIFYASSRFRFPMVPFLLIGSGAFFMALIPFSYQKKTFAAGGFLIACLLFWISTIVEVPSYDDNDSHLLAKAYLEDRKPQLARNVALNASKKFPNQERFLIQLGLASLQEHKYDEALNFIYDAGEINPLQADVWNNAGLILLKKGKPEEAIHALEKALRLLPRSQTLLLLGQAWESLGHDGNARSLYEKVIKREKPGSLLTLQAREYLGLL